MLTGFSRTLSISDVISQLLMQLGVTLALLHETYAPAMQSHVKILWPYVKNCCYNVFVRNEVKRSLRYSRGQRNILMNTTLKREMRFDWPVRQENMETTMFHLHRNLLLSWEFAGIHVVNFFCERIIFNILWILVKIIHIISPNQWRLPFSERCFSILFDLATSLVLHQRHGCKPWQVPRHPLRHNSESAVLQRPTVHWRCWFSHFIG